MLTAGLTEGAGVSAVPVVPEPVRRALFEAARSGDTAAVVALLDTGWDPLVREAETGKVLLHLLPGLDHIILLDRLQRAGADVNAADAQGHTVLRSAVCGGGSPGLVGAPADAGADPLVFDGELFVWLEDHRRAGPSANPSPATPTGCGR